MKPFFAGVAVWALFWAVWNLRVARDSTIRRFHLYMAAAQFAGAIIATVAWAVV